MDEWANKDYRIHILHTNNQGVSAARNSGIKLAASMTEEGNIHFIDIDDELSPDCYRNLSNKLCELEIEPDIIVFGYTTNYVNNNGRVVRQEVTAPKSDCLICDNETAYY